MGYTHYWRREKGFSIGLMKQIVDDFKKTLPEILGLVDLAGGDGEGKPTIANNLVSFNGRAKCGHPEDYLGITWPSENAGGIANPYKEDVVSGNWFAGATLNKRTCGGDCSHETFYFPRIMEIEKWQNPEKGLYFEFCKTAFKPYDLAVIVLLIIAKHYLKEKMIVSSDGNDNHWADGKALCQKVLGYGIDLKFMEGNLCSRIQ